MRVLTPALIGAPPKRPRRSLLLIAAAVAACGSPPDPAQPRAVDVDLATRGIDRALGVTSLFTTMGVITTSAPVGTVAGALNVEVMSETNGCATTVLNGPTLSIDVSNGCTFAGAAVVYRGTIDATVIANGSDVLVQSTLNLTVDGGTALAGTVTVDTTDGDTFGFGLDVTFGGVHVAMPSLAVGVGGFGATFDGMGTLDGTTGSYQLHATAAHQQFGGCYPDAGVLELVQAATMLDETWTFASDTPQSGAVQVADGLDGTPRTLMMPARAGCPNTPGAMTGNPVPGVDGGATDDAGM